MKILPAGLVDNSLEVFRDGNATKCIINGNVREYLELPSVLREPFQVELLKDKAACKCIRDDFRIVDLDEMEERFVWCRYGALDSSPDWNGIELTPDAPTCDKIKDCPGFDIVCKVPVGENGKLSRNEYLVAKLVGEQLFDKEIADRLGIEVTTVRTYLTRIREKLNVNNRLGIGFWAMSKGIV